MPFKTVNYPSKCSPMSIQLLSIAKRLANAQPIRHFSHIFYQHLRFLTCNTSTDSHIACYSPPTYVYVLGMYLADFALPQSPNMIMIMCIIHSVFIEPYIMLYFNCHLVNKSFHGIAERTVHVIVWLHQPYAYVFDVCIWSCR